jgi:hypothetical protein
MQTHEPRNLPNSREAVESVNPFKSYKFKIFLRFLLAGGVSGWGFGWVVVANGTRC